MNNSVTEAAQAVLDQVRRSVVGKDAALLWVLAAILAKGHILLEDIPGVGKTTLALAFSQVLSLEHSRVQLTPDVLPSDITGYSIPDREGNLQYRPGAVMTNLFLADELNRATSRTQSALLEAMEEHQVTVDGIRHPLPQPFVVIATQNPLGAAGTQRLPDSQVDRFAIRLSLGYPTPQEEAAMVLSRQNGPPSLCPVLTREQLLSLQAVVANTYLGEAAAEYLVNLVGATRSHPELSRGASPRATLSLAAMARAVAQLRGRDYVVPGDVREVFPQALGHRLLLSAAAEVQGQTTESILSEIVDSVPVPKLR